MTTLYRHVFVLIAIFFLCVFIPRASYAASVKFDRGTVSVGANETFTLDAVVDAGSDQITSTDMWILYDATFLEAQNASSGAFFPAVTNNITSGKVYVAGLITDPGTYKTGSGAVAKITFKALKNGTTTISYDCRADVSNSSKVIKNAVDPVNVINCAQNGTSIITIGTGGVVTTPIPTTIYSPGTPASTLPRTGFMDELPRLSMIGGILVVAGVLLRVMLIL